MTAIPEDTQDSDNEDEQGRNQQGRAEENQAGVTGEVQEGIEQAQNQGNAGKTGGQIELQDNGTTEGLQDLTSTQVDTESQIDVVIEADRAIRCNWNTVTISLSNTYFGEPFWHVLERKGSWHFDGVVVSFLLALFR